MAPFRPDYVIGKTPAGTSTFGAPPNRLRIGFYPFLEFESEETMRSQPSALKWTSGWEAGGDWVYLVFPPAGKHKGKKKKKKKENKETLALHFSPPAFAGFLLPPRSPSCS